MNNFNPFDDVNCKYGSPMGRVSVGDLSGTPRDRIEARRARGTDGDYDEGGAYWGGPIVNVWAVWERSRGSETVQYVRADSREEAISRALGEVGGYAFQERAPNEFHSEAAAVAGSQLDAFTAAYIEALYFTNGRGIDEDEFGPDDELDPHEVGHIKRDCEDFQLEVKDLLAEAYSQDGYDRTQAGHDFWMTRNGHGTGFWDRGLPDAVGQALTEAAHAAGSVHPYKGDDGLVYLEAA